MFAAAAATEPDVMAAYKQLLLKVHYKVMSRPAEFDVKKEAISNRERLVDDQRAAKTTALGMLLLLVQKKRDLQGAAGKVTTDKVYQYFKDCHWAKDSERPSLTLLENAYSLWNKVEQAPTMLDTMMEAESQFGIDSPFSLVGQMYHASLQCKKAAPAKTAWVWEAILDAMRAGKLHREDISKHRLCNSDVSLISLISVFCWKYDLLQELLHTELAAAGLSAQDCSMGSLI